MGRAILFIVILAIAGAITVLKSMACRVTRNEALKNTSLRGETKKVMDKTAKGVSWMEKQWDESKEKADSSTKKISKDDS